MKNNNNFIRDLKSMGWNSLNSSSDVNVMWQEWKNIFLGVIDRYAPLKMYQKKFTETNYLELWNQYKQAQNLANLA